MQGPTSRRLATRAIRDGDEWVLSGQKVWTTWAHFSDFAVCLARTDPSAKKRHGLTYFIVDLHAVGVDIRPLRHMGGEVDFNEVFLDEVRVPDTDRTRCGRRRLAGRGFEPGGRAADGVRGRIRGRRPDRRRRAWPRCSNSAEELGRTTSNPAIRQRLMSVYAEERVRDWTNQRVRAAVRGGGTPGASASIGKVHQGALNQSLQLLAADLLGMDATALGGGDRYHEAHAVRRSRASCASRANTIEGGTSEVNKNILGERVLGLPREPDPWADSPWEDDTALMSDDAPSSAGAASLADLSMQHPFGDDEGLLHTVDRTVTAGEALARGPPAGRHVGSASPGRPSPCSCRTARSSSRPWSGCGSLAGSTCRSTPVSPLPRSLGARGDRARGVRHRSRHRAPTIDAADYDDDIAFVMWTSGTTGRPKPVHHTHTAYVELLDRVLGPLRGGTGSGSAHRLAGRPRT